MFIEAPYRMNIFLPAKRVVKFQWSTLRSSGAKEFFCQINFARLTIDMRLLCSQALLSDSLRTWNHGEVWSCTKEGGLTCRRSGWAAS